MQNGGGEAAAAEVNVGPTKRRGRPSVRLHQPYYENPGHRKLRQQWKAIKEDKGGARKPRTAKTAHAKNKKNDGVSDSSKGEMEGLNFDDDVAIGNWKNFNAANRDRDFKRKRVRPSSSKKWASMNSRDNEDPEIEKFPLSSGGESGKQGEAEEGEEEENLGGNGINSNLVVENSDPSSPNCSFGDDDGNDNDNVGGNLRMKQRGWGNGPYSDQMGDEGRTGEGESYRDRDGVRVWLNELGLGKYATLFEVHEVDDEVLPFLTLEDLKDMGINAVGSRRKMFSSIQKLSKGFM
ncbi:uncharacterized protein LOC105158497 [Sesamum indicum]|uniref:Uncharacterized protein LOC105158497 n=1 Tax=Sesamum indicum TaxID=4182 RepID=A0A6I9STD1_SESIN|nr:uncharacterized protein LOC105158497 [Sesamum indicum]